MFQIEILGIYFNKKHLKNRQKNDLTLFVFHFEISGKEIKDLQPLKIKLILFTLFVFHFEISVKEINFVQPLKIKLIFFILFVFHFEISGKEIKGEQPLKYNSYHLHYLNSILKYQVMKLKNYNL